MKFRKTTTLLLGLGGILSSLYAVNAEDKETQTDPVMVISPSSLSHEEKLQIERIIASSTRTSTGIITSPPVSRTSTSTITFPPASRTSTQTSTVTSPPASGTSTQTSTVTSPPASGTSAQTSTATSPLVSSTNTSTVFSLSASRASTQTSTATSPLVSSTNTSTVFSLSDSTQTSIPSPSSVTTPKAQAKQAGTSSVRRSRYPKRNYDYDYGGYGYGCYGYGSYGYGDTDHHRDHIDYRSSTNYRSNPSSHAPVTLAKQVSTTVLQKSSSTTPVLPQPNQVSKSSASQVSSPPTLLTQAGSAQEGNRSMNTLSVPQTSSVPPSEPTSLHTDSNSAFAPFPLFSSNPFNLHSEPTSLHADSNSAFAPFSLFGSNPFNLHSITAESQRSQTTRAAAAPSLVSTESSDSSSSVSPPVARPSDLRHRRTSPNPYDSSFSTTRSVPFDLSQFPPSSPVPPLPHSRRGVSSSASADLHVHLVSPPPPSFPGRSHSPAVDMHVRVQSPPPSIVTPFKDLNSDETLSKAISDATRIIAANIDGLSESDQVKMAQLMAITLRPGANVDVNVNGSQSMTPPIVNFDPEDIPKPLGKK